MNEAGQAGFSLMEMVCAMALIAILATVLLPMAPRQTSRARLQAYALETATLLKSDRNAAIRAGAETLTWATAGFCILRGLPVLLEGWRYFGAKLQRDPSGGRALAKYGRTAQTASANGVSWSTG